MELSELRRMARVALWTVGLGGAREGAHGACAAETARDLRGVRRRAAVVFQGAGAHASGACRRRGLAAGLCARATAAQVEERCRQIRNSGRSRPTPHSVSWERRSLSVWRSPGRAPLTDQSGVAARGGRSSIAEGARPSGRSGRGRDAAPSSRWERPGEREQVDALVAVAKSYLAAATVGGIDGGCRGSLSSGRARRRSKPSAEGSGRSRLAHRYDQAAHVRRKLDHGRRGRARQSARRRPQAAHGFDAAEARVVGARPRLHVPGCHRTRFVDAHHIVTGRTAARRASATPRLLCTYHHRLLHEGGFSIRRDGSGELYFQRADGRAIPRFGYQADDVSMSRTRWTTLPRKRG